MTRNRKAFTLVELIVVIAIIAVLSVISVLIVSEWIGKSRDTRRLGDMNQIEKGLEVSKVQNSAYPMPDAYATIVSGTTITLGYQGKFCDGAVTKTSLKAAPKDPLDDACYTYYVNSDSSKYELLGFLESNKKVASYNNGVYAADYSKRYPKIKGEKLGVILSVNTNQPLEDNTAGSQIDLASTSNDGKYVSYFTDSELVSGAASLLFSSVVNKRPELYATTASSDTSLLAYYDMETTNSSSTLKNMAASTNLATSSSPSISLGGVSGKYSKATVFSKNGVLTLGTSIANGKTFTAWINPNSWLDTASSSGTKILVFNNSYIALNSGNMSLTFSTGSSSWTTVANSITLSNWYHIAVVYDTAISTNPSIYINGQLQTSTTTNAPALTSNTTSVIGGLNSTTERFDGVIDEVRVYNRALGASEIQSFYNTTK